MALRLLLPILLLIGTTASGAHATTWYVKHDGTGDAPTIRAGVDSSLSGDTVLVAPGVYEFTTGVWMKDGIVVTSETGPYNTRIIPESSYTPSYAFGCQHLWNRTEISGFWIEGFRWGMSQTGAISAFECEYLYIANNVMIGNGAAAIAVSGRYSLVYIRGNTITNSREYGIYGGGANGFVANNIVWDRVVELTGFAQVYCNCFLDASDLGVAGPNFEEDPQFCGSPDNGNVFLQSDSPCAPGNTPPPLPDCGLVGALPVGCGTSPVKNMDWGRIKSLYE